MYKVKGYEDEMLHFLRKSLNFSGPGVLYYPQSRVERKSGSRMEVFLEVLCISSSNWEDDILNDVSAVPEIQRSMFDF